jgi:hypothetical protein
VVTGAELTEIVRLIERLIDAEGPEFEDVMEEVRDSGLWQEVITGLVIEVQRHFG